LLQRSYAHGSIACEGCRMLRSREAFASVSK
jgi:hypothetical protein